MSNPIRLHTNGMFATRETFDDAMAYAHELLNSISDKQAGDKIAALTALMVVVNTASKLWPEAPAQVAEAPAFDLDTRIAALASRVVDLEQSLGSTARVGWTRDELTELVQSELSTWADDSFNDLVDDWLRNHADLGQEIENWMENNFDLENDVRNVLSEANLSITF